MSEPVEQALTEQELTAEDHVNEEPRNDFSDVLIGFSVSFGFFLLVGVIATVIELLI